MVKENEPLVGVVMPAYNQGQYVGEAIDSLKKQTFQDFFVHIIDDGSNDGVTPDVLKSVEYEKAKVFLYKMNRGVAYRVREHFAKLKTKYVMVFCADDILAPTFLEETIKKMDENPKCGIVSTNIYEFSENYKMEIKFDKKKMTLPYMLSRCYCLGSSLIRKQSLENLDYSGGFIRYQDWDRLTTIIENGWEAELVEKPLFYYRQLPTSLSHTMSVDEEVDTRKKMLKKHAKYYKKYYETVILDMQYHFSEMKMGKNWLDEQYHYLNEEIKRLKNDNRVLSDQNKQLSKEKNSRFRVKNCVKRIIGKH